MIPQPWQTTIVRLLSLAALACGVIGLISGFLDRDWKLTTTGWFTGGILVAALALIFLAEGYLQRRRDAPTGRD